MLLLLSTFEITYIVSGVALNSTHSLLLLLYTVLLLFCILNKSVIYAAIKMFVMLLNNIFCICCMREKWYGWAPRP